jgi:pilus assembly protein CpaC
MLSTMFVKRSLAGLVSAALTTVPTAGMAQTAGKSAARTVRVGQPVGVQRPTREVLLSIGQGELITLPTNVASVWISNPGVADVYVNNPRQIHLYGKEFGEATLFATAANGAVLYSASVRVSQNITSIDRMLKAAMPDADITVTTVGQIAVLNGVVKSPQDAEQAQRLVTGLLNPGVNVNTEGAMLKVMVINRLKTATPLQV